MCPSPTGIELFPDPAISAVCDGVPILAYGETHVLQASPDLVEPESLQVGNDAPCRKLPLKRSAEIGFNQLGGTTPRMPRTVANDYRPLEPIHLIDGDPTTCWCSRSVAQPEAEPAWIRLDLPAEREITRIVLRKRIPGAPRNQVGSMRLDTGAVEVGMALPEVLSIRVARDAMTWETVFSGETGDSPDLREFVCSFPARPAKQIWIVGERLTRIENWHFSFSIAEVEALDAAGNNLALARRGTGVTVSSTQHNMGQTREEHHRMWPLITDLGLKWARIGYHDDPVNWHWVEQEKGVLAVDPEADAAITYLVERGVDIVLALGFGNRLYEGDPVRHLPQLWEWYYENPMPPTTPEALAGWGRYVRFMCRKYRDRIKVFEVWNEWNISVYWGTEPNLEHYLAIARVAIPIIREECPEAKVMLGSVSGFCHGIARTGVPEPGSRSLFLDAVAALAPDVDLIGWHPFYQTGAESENYREYADNIRVFCAWAEEQGFRGEYLASEYNYGANYPEAAKPHWWGNADCTELQKAKYVAQISTLHTALGIGSFFCEVWGNPTYPHDLSLMRRAFNADPFTPLQPQAAYYAMRNLATALDGCRPADFAHEVTGGESIQVCPMGCPGEQVLALWLPGIPVDDKAGQPVDIRVCGAYTRVVGYDCLSGCEQELASETDGDDTSVRGVLVRDYPLLVRFM
jgi:hypothetical protein